VLCLEQLIVLLFFLAGCSPAGSQTITGILPLDVGSEIRLEGFNPKLSLTNDNFGFNPD